MKKTITRAQAEHLAESIKARYERLPEDAGQGLESKTWDAAFVVLLEWAREVSADAKRSRSLLSLASFLVGSDTKRERAYDEALESHELALKCKECGADQDAYGTTCDDGEDHHDACGYCGVCPDCDGSEAWVRPSKNERLTRGGKWASK